jgi:hypothetical protein
MKQQEQQHDHRYQNQKQDDSVVQAHGTLDIRDRTSATTAKARSEVRGQIAEVETLALTFLFHWLMVIRIVRPIAWPMEHEGAGTQIEWQATFVSLIWAQNMGPEFRVGTRGPGFV